MWPDRCSNQRPLDSQSDSLPTALGGPARRPVPCVLSTSEIVEPNSEQHGVWLGNLKENYNFITDIRFELNCDSYTLYKHFQKFITSSDVFNF